MTDPGPTDYWDAVAADPQRIAAEVYGDHILSDDLAAIDPALEIAPYDVVTEIGSAVEIAAALRPGGRLRFQWVRAADQGLMSHPVGTAPSRWCHEVGLVVTAVDTGLIHSDWSWVTAYRDG